MNRDQIIEKMIEEKKTFKHYAYQNKKQRDAYLFYHLCMTSYIAHPEDYYSRRAALHFLKRYKKLTLNY